LKFSSTASIQLIFGDVTQMQLAVSGAFVFSYLQLLHGEHKSWIPNLFLWKYSFWGKIST